MTRLVINIIIGSVVLSSSAVSVTPIVLPLHKSIQQHQRVSVHHLISHDRKRHDRIFNGTSIFRLDANSSQLGFYLTKIWIGTPATELNVMPDTHSNDLWVSCVSCMDCPVVSGTECQVNSFDPSASSTSSMISCSDPFCSQCSENNHCSYSDIYEDGSGTAGYYVKDTLYFNAMLRGSVAANSSAPIIFGCSTHRSGKLSAGSYNGIDGVIGFGRGQSSVISQLSSMQQTPNIFSHCLRGDHSGGLLVLGEALDSSIVYTPLVPRKAHYNVHLESIFVDGQVLRIDKSAYKTSTDRGTVIDMGTTLAYLVKEAYDQIYAQGRLTGECMTLAYTCPSVS